MNDSTAELYKQAVLNTILLNSFAVYYSEFSNILSAGRGEVLFCRLVASTLSSRHLIMQPAAANIICSVLRLWADQSSENDESGDRQLQVEALQALGAMLQDNFAQVL